MRCKHCEYNLWALRARACPECGRPFVPSEFDFVPGSVRFTCPHCDQSYYGTAANGHLVPAEFDCTTCGKHIHMDEMVLFPAAGVSEEQTRPEIMPWLERRERGRVGAWFRTVGMALVAPRKLIRLTPAGSAHVDGWLFALICQSVYISLGISSLVFFFMFMFGGMPGFGIGPIGASGVFVLISLGFCLVTMLVIAVWGALAHLMLVLTGKTAHPLARTYQAMCYGSGANVLLAVPCVGMYLNNISIIWWIVSSILMLKEGQRVHGGRATLAVLTFPSLLIAGFILLAVVTQNWFNPSVVTVTAGSNPLVQQTQFAKGQTVQEALLAYIEHHENEPPAHALELVFTNYLPDGGALLISDVQKRKRQITVAGVTLAEYESLSFNDRRRVTQAAAAGLPDRPVVHRLGDFIFTYHGLPFGSDLDPGLWLFIIWPEGRSFDEAPDEAVTIGNFGGTMHEVSTSLFGEMLKEQNKLRLKYGLPPLANLDNVPHVTTRPTQ